MPANTIAAPPPQPKSSLPAPIAVFVVTPAKAGVQREFRLSNTGVGLGPAAESALTVVVFAGILAP